MSKFETLLMHAASELIRNERAEWACAMRAELEYVDERERSRWAFGCLLAAIQLRIRAMGNGTLRVSRWILLSEFTLCFLPLTLVWLDITFGGNSVWHLSAMLMDHSDSTLNASMLGMMFGGVLVGLIGPVGFALGVQAVTSGVGLSNRTAGLGMIAALSVYATASVSLRLVGGPGAYAANLEFIVLMFLLPATGVLHLLHLGKQEIGIRSDNSIPA